MEDDNIADFEFFAAGLREFCPFASGAQAPLGILPRSAIFPCYAHSRMLGCRIDQAGCVPAAHGMRIFFFAALLLHVETLKEPWICWDRSFYHTNDNIYAASYILTLLMDCHRLNKKKIIILPRNCRVILEFVEATSLGWGMFGPSGTSTMSCARGEALDEEELNF